MVSPIFIVQLPYGAVEQRGGGGGTDLNRTIGNL